MSLLRLDIDEEQIVLHTERTICSTTQELVESTAFARVVDMYLDTLAVQNSALLTDLGVDPADFGRRARLLDHLRLLANNPIERLAGASPEGAALLERRGPLHQFVEGLYDYWRGFDRFMVSHSEAGPAAGDRRPYRAFNETVGILGDLVRGLYRDVAENITGEHPRIYRQVAAGAEVGVIAVQKPWRAPGRYGDVFAGIPFVRHVLMYPPLILDPPMNTRTGRFVEAVDDPLAGVHLEARDWICYPAVVGPLVVFVFVHQRFLGLGLSLANLFEIATDEQIAAGPDAVCVFGAAPAALRRFGEVPTVFYDDPATGMLLGAIPLEERFGYFGYLKKLVLTLHNLAVMRRGRMPFHGAFTHIRLRGGTSANVLLVGDTATGKSESLEALRQAGEARIAELRVIADDMGSLEVVGGAGEGGPTVLGYGTEIGAFVRLDDLQRGYAFGQIDRAIIMSPHKVNARVVLPVTTLDEVLHGYPVDFLLYANNYEEVDDRHPMIERFTTLDEATHIFREGYAMSKGTTTSTGLVHTYFANVFGPAQRMETHDEIAGRVFAAAFAAGVYVGQLRTRLGVTGYETRGPAEAAAALLQAISATRRATDADEGRTTGPRGGSS
jgi:hypothetical protein